MSSVYVETTIVSYLTARPSRDVVAAGHQETTRQWWEMARPRYDLFISEVVLRELQAGDPAAAILRIQKTTDIPLLAINDDVAALARIYQAELQLPPKAGNDILHIAFSVAYNIDYLLTWNCAHIANGHTIKRLSALNDRLGRSTPVIVTPEELME
ncbi:MAG TPA: type II toxin-antitoxin system VapC family toxin [Tepidisphaeraceae bacterium]|jgi:predicted nucleic acid-binding protein|nr:type II toxin-antitoxin system VapC family toxin [Tepidisphaeraceae bacterium]